MKYFLIETDYHNPFPEIINWYKRIPPRQLKAENFNQIEDFTLLDIKADEHTVFPDILTNPYFLLSADAREIVNSYEPAMQMKGVRLYQSQNGINQEYYLPLLPVLSCLSEDSEFLHKSIDVKRAVIWEDKTNGRTLFQIGGIEKRRVVIRMDLLESLLRREAFGFFLKEVEVISAEGGML